MIFSVPGHIRMVIRGDKTQTRRDSDRYTVGRDYSIQPGRGSPGMPQGRIEILDAWIEDRTGHLETMLSREDARAEGYYTPKEYERLYEGMHPGWESRVSYRLMFIPAEPYPGYYDLLQAGCCPNDCGYLTILRTPIPVRRILDTELLIQLDQSPETERKLRQAVRVVCKNCGYFLLENPDDLHPILPEPEKWGAVF